MNVEKHLRMLGVRTRDRVTGLEGVVTSVSFDLFGCIMCILQPQVKDEGKTPEGKWMDIQRLEVLDPSPVMPIPSFAPSPQLHEKGPAERPDHYR